MTNIDDLFYEALETKNLRRLEKFLNQTFIIMQAEGAIYKDFLLR